ncbi:G protein-coupled glucose receptor regulating Gpa2-domain-containing protein [Xylaria sp. CBS 124048]|nr:G protein-coupled glucose receptor regulating Gpa2-domain-containing protein [Xylaria sp. CBS 124048]
MAPLQQLPPVDTNGFMPTTYIDLLMAQDMTRIIDAIDSRTLVVMCISLSLATISVIAALFAFYWFVRMRRGFRQDMIMLLIQSDMAKALWLIISPVFQIITKKPFDSNWTFCQVSGFFLTVTIEASDIAVLLIAIHTALFIIKRKQSGSAIGLQPYRRIAYTLWAVVPILLAAVVPITGGNFVDNGPHCYLPIQPNWYRNALSWGPRYIIFGFILVTYTWLYLYVFISYRRFGEDQRRAINRKSPSPLRSTCRQSERGWKCQKISLMHNAFAHDVPDSTREKASNNNSSRHRRGSLASTVSTLLLGESVATPAVPKRAEQRRSMSWDHINFEHENISSPANNSPHIDIAPVSPTTKPFVPLLSGAIDSVTTDTVRVPEPIHVPGERDSPSHIICRSYHSVLRRKLTSARRKSYKVFRDSTTSIMTALRQGGPRPGEQTEAGSGEENRLSYEYLEAEISDEATQRSREKMQRQMWLLFVYPAIYMLTWVAPLVAHVCHYDDVYILTYSGGPHPKITVDSAVDSTVVTASGARQFVLTAAPFALRIVSMASLCIGAAVDCCFFSAWERPWQHLRGGFWEGLAMRLRVHRLCGRDSGERTRGPGRDRDQMFVDERTARTRRERERVMTLALRSERAAAEGRGTAGGTGGEAKNGGGGVDNHARREWWDALDDSSL